MSDHPYHLPPLVGPPLSQPGLPDGAVPDDALSETAEQPRIRGGFAAWRWLDAYPLLLVRARIVVLAAVVMLAANYEISAGDGVAQQVTAKFGMSLQYYPWIGVAGAVLGALVGFAGGLADRWGRYPVIGIGLFVNALLTLAVMPHLSGRVTFAVVTVLVSMVAGVVMVASAALARDFSQQGSRGLAMALWITGTVVGREIAMKSVGPHSSWTFSYQLCGIVSLVVCAAALVGVRDLVPEVRDQVAEVASGRARRSRIRARSASDETAVDGPRVTRTRLVLVTMSMSGFLLAYYTLTALFSLQYLMISGLTAKHGAGVTDWYWIVDVIALLVAGGLSDLVRVRKPLMVVGAVLAGVSALVFAVKAPKPMSYSLLTLLMVVFVIGGAMAYSAGTAAFTETVERRNPSAVAGGLALWTALQRMLVAVPCALLPAAFLTYSPIVSGALQAQAIAAEYPTQLATMQALDPVTAAKLKTDPTNPQVQAQALADIGAPQGLTAADVLQVMAISQKYSAQLAVLGSLDPQTATTLAQNPNDDHAQNQALADVSGGKLTADDVAKVKAISQKYPTQLATLALLDPATSAALAKNPNDDAAQNQALADVSGGTLTAADVAKVKAISKQYSTQLATLALLDPATSAALAKNPNDDAAQNQALADVSGGKLTAADVAQVKQVSQKYATQLATLAAIDPATAAAMAGPNAMSASTKAVGEIATAFHLSQWDAWGRLMAVSQIPAADMNVIRTKAPLVQAAGAKLQTANQIPPADMAVMATKGPLVQAAGAKLQTANQIPAADLVLLQTKGPLVQAAGAKLQAAGTVPITKLNALAQFMTSLQKALASIPSALRNTSIIGAGMILGILQILRYLVGRWSPRRARQDARDR